MSIWRIYNLLLFFVCVAAIIIRHPNLYAFVVGYAMVVSALIAMKVIK